LLFKDSGTIITPLNKLPENLYLKVFSGQFQGKGFQM